MNKQCYEQLILNVAALSSHISGVNLELISSWGGVFFMFYWIENSGKLGSQIFQLKCIALSS